MDGKRQTIISPARGHLGGLGDEHAAIPRMLGVGPSLR